MRNQFFCLLLFCASTVSGQINPTMTKQYRNEEKESYYAKFQEHKKIPTGEQQRLAYEDAKRYLDRFGGDNDANSQTVRKFVAEYERFIQTHDINAAFGAKNYGRTFEIGRPIVKNDPENFYVLAVLVGAGYANALAGDGSLNAETADYARKAIRLIEDGKVSKPDPIKSMPIAEGFLNYMLGWLIRDQLPVEAAAAFVRAAKIDNPYRANPLTYRLLGVAILKGEFAQMTSEYNEKFGSKPSSPDQTAMLARITALADRAIDAYARAVALSTNPQQQEVRGKMLKQLTALYKNFHNNSDAGLEELISTVLTRPLP